MAEAVSIIFATHNQVLKLEFSSLYQHFFIFLPEKYDQISLLLKRNEMEGEIDVGKNEDCFICSDLGSKSI